MISLSFHKEVKKAFGIPEVITSLLLICAVIALFLWVSIIIFVVAKDSVAGYPQAIFNGVVVGTMIVLGGIFLPIATILVIIGLVMGRFYKK